MYRQLFQSLYETRKIKAFDIAMLLQQLATLISANIALIKCCDILISMQQKNSLRILIHDIKQQLLSGKTLHLSMKRYPHYFDMLTCQLIKIGEQTGKLDTLLISIANHHEKNIAFKRQLKQMLFYPCIIMLTSFLITACMFIFVIPHFAEFFSNSQDTLPFITRIIFDMALFLNQHLLWIGLGLCIFICGFFHEPTLCRMKALFNRILHFIPAIPHCQHHLLLIKFARNLALTYAAGVPIMEALPLSSQTTTQSRFIQQLKLLQYKVISGVPLHQAMHTNSYYPAIMVQMVKIGEETGRLDDMLHKCADIMEADINQTIQRFSQMLEPLIMVVLGVLIGGLVIGMYLPIFKLGSAL